MTGGRIKRVAGESVRRRRNLWATGGLNDRPASLNTIAVQADLEATLHALAGDVDVTLPDPTSFFWEDGHVWSENEDAEPMTCCARGLMVS